jgi:hypothetical protein
MFNWLINLFKKDEEEQFYPAHFLRVVLSSVAQSRGINDDFNKEIQRVKNGKVIEIFTFSEELLNNLINVYEIPVYKELPTDEEEYEFDTFNEPGTVIYKK